MICATDGSAAKYFGILTQWVKWRTFIIEKLKKGGQPSENHWLPALAYRRRSVFFFLHVHSAAAVDYLAGDV